MEKGGNPAKTSSRAGQVVHSCLPNSQACRAVLSSAIPEKAANRACVIASVRVTYHRCLTGGRRRHGWLCPNPSWSPYLHVTACPRVCGRQSSLSRDFIHSLSFYNSVFLRLSLSLSLCPRSLSLSDASPRYSESAVSRGSKLASGTVLFLQVIGRESFSLKCLLHAPPKLLFVIYFI